MSGKTYGPRGLGAVPAALRGGPAPKLAPSCMLGPEARCATTLFVAPAGSLFATVLDARRMRVSGAASFDNEGRAVTIDSVLRNCCGAGRGLGWMSRHS